MKRRPYHKLTHLRHHHRNQIAIKSLNRNQIAIKSQSKGSKREVAEVEMGLGGIKKAYFSPPLGSRREVTRDYKVINRLFADYPSTSGTGGFICCCEGGREDECLHRSGLYQRFPRNAISAAMSDRTYCLPSRCLLCRVCHRRNGSLLSSAMSLSKKSPCCTKLIYGED